MATAENRARQIMRHGEGAMLSELTRLIETVATLKERNGKLKAQRDEAIDKLVELTNERAVVFGIPKP